MPDTEVNRHSDLIQILLNEQRDHGKHLLVIIEYFETMSRKLDMALQHAEKLLQASPVASPSPTPKTLAAVDSQGAALSAAGATGTGAPASPPDPNKLSLSLESKAS